VEVPADMLDEYLVTEDFDGWEDLAETLGEVLHEDYADAAPEELDEALVNMFESLAPAEAFNLSKALNQAGKSARRALEDPPLAHVAAAAIPLAGGAVGAFGGPLGVGVGTQLGQVAAQALTARGKPRPAPGPPGPTPPPAGGSPAAATGLLMTQKPQALRSLLSVALGEHGRKSIDGVPVSAIMNLLSSIFSQAAADADELGRGSSEPPAYLHDAEDGLRVDPVSPVDRAQALYATLVAEENAALAEAVEPL
jgi:hypothetical protein